MINADFTKRALVRPSDAPWTPSPMPGVDRRMLDRVGEETARATSIVRYAPDSAFSSHSHDLGEEYLVLDGVFTDEDGDHGVGAYVRNPPGSSHTPSSAPGTTIFVKLRQFDPDDRAHVVVDSADPAAFAADSVWKADVAPLHDDDRETVRRARWAAEAPVALPAAGGIELLVLGGALVEGGETLPTGSWLRLPAGEALAATAGPDGADLGVKILAIS
ncbi:MAG: cupin domain-containing protein [Pseudomonadota bacterium]